MGGIDWSEVSTILLTSLTSAVFTGIFTGILIFIFQKAVVERWMARNLEQFKIDLQLAASEHQIRFAKLYEGRAKAIAELYTFLVRAEDSLRAVANTDLDVLSERTEKIGIAHESVQAFRSCFNEQRIYLTEDLCRRIEGMHRRLKSPHV